MDKSIWYSYDSYIKAETLKSQAFTINVSISDSTREQSHIVVELILDRSYRSPGAANYVCVHVYLELEIHRIYIFLVVLLYL